MALIRWQPFPEIETLRRQMDQMFDEVIGSERQSATTWTPVIELQDTQENLVLRAAIPGVEGKDIDIRVTREAVAISGEHRLEQKNQEQGFFRSEFRYGSFQRVVSLPVPIQNDRVHAEFKNGILTLTLPKVREAQHTVIKLSLEDNSNSATSGLIGQAASQDTMN